MSPDVPAGTRGAGGRTGPRWRPWVAGATVLFTLVLLLQVLGGPEHDIFATAYVVPILVLAAGLGRTGGLVGAAVATALVTVRLLVEDVDEPALRVAVRAVVFAVIGLTVGTVVEHLRRGQALLDGVMEGVTDAVFVKDRHHRYLVMSRAGAAMVGRRRADIEGRTDAEVFGPEVARQLLDDDRAVMRAGTTSVIDEGVPDDPSRTIWTSKSPWRDNRGEVVGVVGVARDLTDRVRADRDLAAAQVRFHRAFDGSPIGMAICDLDGRFTQVNGALAALLRRPVEEVVGRHWSVFTHPDDVPAVAAAQEHLLTGTGDSWQAEKRYLTAAGEAVWAHCTLALVRDEEGQPAYWLPQFVDVTDRRRTHELLVHRALHDALTGLPNRTLLLERVEHALRRHRPGAGRVALLFLDLDRFKPVNDTLGHPAGDLVLAEVARRLQAVVRPGDTVARLGGDEFTMLCEDLASPEDAHHIADRAREAVLRPVRVGGHEVFVGASVGIALAGDPAAATPETLLADADTAMYAAKRGDRSVAVHTEDMRAVGAHRLDTESGLRRALADDGFVVEYQPQVELATGRVVGAEALVRWRRPDGRVEPPSSFVPLAEETGLIVAIGQVVLTRAAAAAAGWCRALGHTEMRLAVNLSARQFADARLCKKVHSVLSEHGLPAGLLELEITESVLMRDAETTLGTLSELKELGVRLAVDDFGTGYSSLSYLQRFPVDRVKVDASFVRTLAAPGDASSTLVGAVVSMAHALDLDVVAEGVETPVQLEVLRAAGVDVAQGYLLGRPGPPQALDDRAGAAPPG